MVRCGTIAYLCLIICTWRCPLVVGINLYQGNSKHRIARFSSTTDSVNESMVSSTLSATKADLGVAEYRYTEGGSTCILLEADALIEIKFKVHGFEEIVDSFMPEKSLVEGDCKNEKFSIIKISWTGYSLFMSFSKTPSGKLWYINSIELTVSGDIPYFRDIQTQGRSIKLYHRSMLIPTPVGKSYSCDELEIDLQTNEDDKPPPDLCGTLFLRIFRVQPFMYKRKDFESPFKCELQIPSRNGTSRFVVGSALTIAVLVTVSGYGIYRYFKQKIDNNNSKK